MKLDTINSDQWAKFRKSFPSAYSFLLSASLKGEYQALVDNNRRNTWEDGRLKELEPLIEQF